MAEALAMPVPVGEVAYEPFPIMERGVVL